MSDKRFSVPKELRTKLTLLISKNKQKQFWSKGIRKYVQQQGPEEFAIRAENKMFCPRKKQIKMLLNLFPRSLSKK